MNQTYYITTPIYYTSGKPHVGHAYCSIMADTLARYHRFIGDDVYFLTGTDEHGQKVEENAAKLNMSPKEFVDSLDVEFKALWKKLNISYDSYIRTTDEHHHVAVQRISKSSTIKEISTKKTMKGIIVFLVKRIGQSISWQRGMFVRLRTACYLAERRELLFPGFKLCEATHGAY